MNTREFSDAFDVLVSSFVGGVTFDEYEKSLFLTQSQDEVEISLYNGSIKDAFEGTEELRRYLEPLVIQQNVTNFEETESSLIDGTYKVKLNSDILFIVYESVDFDKTDCHNYKNIQVQPITHDEYHKVKNNPFRGYNYHRVLRLDCNIAGDDNQYVELVSERPIVLYKYRYLKKANPIILENLDEGLSIKGKTEESQCELHEALHDIILKNAVLKALSSRGINTDKSKT